MTVSASVALNWFCSCVVYETKYGVLWLQFEIVPEDDPQNSIVASSALSCHSDLLKAIAAKM